MFTDDNFIEVPELNGVAMFNLNGDLVHLFVWG